MNILNKEFKYTSAAATDIRKTFAKARRELEAQKKAKPENVTKLPNLRRKP